MIKYLNLLWLLDLLSSPAYLDPWNYLKEPFVLLSGSSQCTTNLVWHIKEKESRKKRPGINWLMKLMNIK